MVKAGSATRQILLEKQQRQREGKRNKMLFKETY